MVLSISNVVAKRESRLDRKIMALRAETVRQGNGFRSLTGVNNNNTMSSFSSSLLHNTNNHHRAGSAREIHWIIKLFLRA